MEDHVKNLGEGAIDESLYREKIILLLNSNARISLDDLSSISQEKEILKFIDKSKEEGTLPPPPKYFIKYFNIDQFHNIKELIYIMFNQI